MPDDSKRPLFVSVPLDETEPTVTVEQIREALEQGARDARKLGERIRRWQWEAWR